MTSDQAGNILRSVSGVSKGSGLVTRFSDGCLYSVVTECRPAEEKKDEETEKL